MVQGFLRLISGLDIASRRWLAQIWTGWGGRGVALNHEVHGTEHCEEQDAGDDLELIERSPAVALASITGSAGSCISALRVAVAS